MISLWNFSLPSAITSMEKEPREDESSICTLKTSSNHKSSLFKCSTGMRLKKAEITAISVSFLPASWPAATPCLEPERLGSRDWGRGWHRRGALNLEPEFTCTVWFALSGATPSCTWRMGHTLCLATGGELTYASPRMGSPPKSPSWDAAPGTLSRGCGLRSGMSLEGRGEGSRALGEK